MEYAGLNPMGGLYSDGVPKAGCPVVVHTPPSIFGFLSFFNFDRTFQCIVPSFWQNLRQTLDDLTRNGFSVVSFDSRFSFI